MCVYVCVCVFNTVTTLSVGAIEYTDLSSAEQ